MTSFHTPSTRTGSLVRRDIQGLRALAVVAVISNHALHWPTGGFLGVDVFFVISGFLITQLLLREAESTSAIGLLRFYGRRIKRLFPVAGAVLGVTVVIGYLVFNTERAKETALDAVSALALSSNWRFAAEGTDYFRATAATSPLQHFWSLSLEGQFYVVWPLLFIVVLACVGSRVITAKTFRWIMGSLVFVLLIASFAFALLQSETDPMVAYFSTLTRAWQLGVGALLAVLAPIFAKLPTLVRVVAGWVGLFGVIASMLLITDTMRLPAPWAAAPVAATALIIAAGVGSQQRNLFPLVNPVSVFIGDLSYSLYLWHLPVIVFLPMVLDATMPWFDAVSFGMIVLLALSSYYVLEEPLRRSPWLSVTGDREAKAEAWANWNQAYAGRFVKAIFGVLAVGLIAVVLTGVLARGGMRVGGTMASVNVAEQAASAAQLDAQVRQQLAAATSATSWPADLSPSLDDAIAQTSTTNPANRCFATGNTPDFGSCTWGSSGAPNHMYLVGDSIALAYAPAFKAIAEQSGGTWQITTIGLYGCRFTSQLVMNNGAGVMDACQQRKNDIAARIVTDQPQLVVMANAFTLGNTTAGSPLSVADLVSGAASEAARYSTAKKIVYLAPPPTGIDLGQCYSRVSTPQNCNAAVSQTWLDFASATTTTAHGSGGEFVSSLDFTCYQNVCPAFAGTLPIRYDAVHLVPAYAEHIAPLIRQAFVGLHLM